MKTIRLEWSRPIPLKDASRENLIYSVDRAHLPEGGGIYVFGRRYGKDFEALYVGRATSFRKRVYGQRKSVPLMLHLKKAKKGTRVVLIARYVPEPGHNAANCIAVAERALIRHFLLEGHDLVNKQGTRLRQLEIHSTGTRRWGSTRIVPAKMLLDRK